MRAFTPRGVAPLSGEDRLRPLRIAIVAPPWFEIPPNAYGGIELMVYNLVEGLVAQGHEVTLIAAGESHTSARFRATFDRTPAGLGELRGGTIELIHASRADRIIRELDLDIVHDHSQAGPLTAAGRLPPTVVTAHGPASGRLGEYYRSLGDGVRFVAISNAQRASAPEVPWIETVHNGIDVDAYPFRDRKDDFLLFLGRVHPEKGVHLAIETARAVGLPLVIAGKCTEPIEVEYFAREIEPRLGPGVTYVGVADQVRKRVLMAGARALVFPVCWEEPFGLVMVEAMACGTPVVALDRGAVPEVVSDGLTGYVCDAPDRLPEAVDAVDAIDPKACRAHVRAHFSAQRMTGCYEAVYAKALRGAVTVRETAVAAL
jgi:glycosyltransferase involved in cell wall biosynthesis